MTTIMEKCFFKKPTQRIFSYELDKKCKTYLKSVSLMDIMKTDSMEKLSCTSIEKCYWSFY